MNAFQIDKIASILKMGNNEKSNPEILSVIYSLGRDAANMEEYHFAFESLLSIYKGATDNVRAYVILSYSLLAVSFKTLDRATVEPMILHEWNTANEKNKAIIQDAVEDINHILHWQLSLPK
ncbi:MAG: hypothetical protein Q4D37_02205 [Oscillospiraceae bacterium]|nr:hypothetical protein [Oscillospiraceae bacterium]